MFAVPYPESKRRTVALALFDGIRNIRVSKRRGSDNGVVKDVDGGGSLSHTRIYSSIVYV